MCCARPLGNSTHTHSVCPDLTIHILSTPSPRALTSSLAFHLADDYVDPNKVRATATGGRGTTFGPGLGRHVKNRDLLPVNLLTSNAYLNYGVNATSGSDRFPHSGSAVFGRSASMSAMGTPSASLTASWRGNSQPVTPNITPGKGVTPRAHSPSFGSPSSAQSFSRTAPAAEVLSEAPPVMQPLEPMQTEPDLVSPSPD